MYFQNTSITWYKFLPYNILFNTTCTGFLQKFRFARKLAYLVTTMLNNKNLTMFLM